MLNVPVIVANWKMHKTVCEAVDFLQGLAPYLPCRDFSFWLAPSFTAVWPLSQWVQQNLDVPLPIGVQNISHKDEGPLTGEVSARQAVEAGAQFVILGHSERRMWGGEGEVELREKLRQAFKNSLTPILCVGEPLEVYQKGCSEQFILSWLKKLLEGISQNFLKKMVIAYEPIWAIGSSEQAERAHVQKIFFVIQNFLRTVSSESVVKKIPIIYGGSVGPLGLSELLSIQGISGVLVGSGALSWKGVVELFKAGVCV